MLLLATSLQAVAADPPTLSPATTMEQAGMVDIRAVVPGIAQDIKYFGSDNFVGARVDGYEAPRCFLKREAAEALAKVEAALRERHQRLRIFDCYRPARAVAHFMRWVNDPADLSTKPAHYPDFEKPQLLDGYIAPMSGHSRGATIDLTLLQCDANGAACAPLDMGTAFDFFGTRANTDSADVDAAQRANRLRLREAMLAAGFRNYPMEWWHYTFQPEPTPGTYYDVPVTAPESPMPDAAIERLMQRYDGDVPGASLLVLHDGVPRVHRGYGRSDLEQGIEAGPATNYRLASVSKQFTAAAILLLAQDARLGIDDPVKRWLPSLPSAADGITLRHLLTHTSGLLDYEDLMAEPHEGQIRDAGVLALLERENRLAFPAGSAYRYSNSGYALLALVAGEASGRDFARFLHERIFEPLGMHDTVAHQDGVDTVARRAYGYSEVDGRWQRTDQSPTSAVLGDGGIYSSIDDLARWDAALYDDRLLSAASRALMFAPATATGEADVPGYGFGWRLNGDSVWHSGESIGFRNVIVRWPGQRLTVLVLSNRNGPEPYPLALAIARLFQAPPP